MMHARLLHGSAPNLSSRPRTLYIATYYAEDAIELSPNHLPSKFTHELRRQFDQIRPKRQNLPQPHQPG